MHQYLHDSHRARLVDSNAAYSQMGNQIKNKGFEESRIRLCFQGQMWHQPNGTNIHLGWSAVNPEITYAQLSTYEMDEEVRERQSRESTLSHTSVCSTKRHKNHFLTVVSRLPTCRKQTGPTL